MAAAVAPPSRTIEDPEERARRQKLQMLDTFRRYDVNGDGVISIEELLAVLKLIDEPGQLRRECVVELLDALDRNDDGLVDFCEFVEWVMTTDIGRSLTDHMEERVGELAATHIFLRPQDEARLERLTLFELHAASNAKALEEAGLGRLDDPRLLVLSVGSSSTQAYDVGGFAESFPVGTKVCSPPSLQQLQRRVQERGVDYTRVVLLNSIGYHLFESDPWHVELQEVAARTVRDASNSTNVARSFHVALQQVLPNATMHVYNRAKDGTTHRYKYPQVVNDFSEALVAERGLAQTAMASAAPHDAVVDWGGASYKVYANGRRVGTEIYDANAVLCEGGTLHRERMQQAIHQIKLFVLGHVPNARHILIAQTGKARELALMEGAPGILVL